MLSCVVAAPLMVLHASARKLSGAGSGTSSCFTSSAVW